MNCYWPYAPGYFWMYVLMNRTLHRTIFPERFIASLIEAPQETHWMPVNFYG